MAVSGRTRSHTCAGSRHGEPARLGDARGLEWWHCRACGALWTRHPVEASVYPSRLVPSVTTGLGLSPAPAPAFRA